MRKKPLTFFAAGRRQGGVLVVCLALCTLALALTFTSFNARGAGTGAGQGTLAIGINSASSPSIVGAYVDSKGAYHGFVRSGSGTITAFNAPGAGTGSCQGTNFAGLSGINTAGTITGPYVDSKGVFHGYIRSTAGKFTILNVASAGKSAGQGTLAGNINTSGEIAGFYTDAAGANHGFLWTSTAGFITFDAPGSGTGAGEGSVTSFFDGLNDGGSVAGNYADTKLVNHGYIRASGGAFSIFSAPKAGTDHTGCPTGVACKGTFASGINKTGTWVGLYVDEGLVNHGLVRSSGGTLTPFDVPGAGTDHTGCPATAPACKGTFPQNINSSGIVVGYYVDNGMVAHGFERSASGIISKFDDPLAGKCAGCGTFTFSNNSSNAITEYYVDSKGVAHGFLAHGFEALNADGTQPSTDIPHSTPMTGSEPQTSFSYQANAPSGSAKLLALYSFNGTLADSSGNGRTAHDSGTPTYVTGAPFGGKAISFNGSGKAIVTAPLNISVAALKQVTFGGWVKALSIATPQYGVISNDDGDFDRSIDIDTRPNGTASWSAFVGGTVVGKVHVVVGKWYFVAVSYDQSTLPGRYAIYVNDGKTTTTLTGVDHFDANSVTTGVTIGRNPNFDNPFKGYAANVFFEHLIMTPTQINNVIVHGPPALPR